MHNFKNYEEPEIVILYLNEEDLITTSGESGGGNTGTTDSDRDWTGEWDTDF